MAKRSFAKINRKKPHLTATIARTMKKLIPIILFFLPLGCQTTKSRTPLHYHNQQGQGSGPAFENDLKTCEASQKQAGKNGHLGDGSTFDQCMSRAGWNIDTD